MAAVALPAPVPISCHAQASVGTTLQEFQIHANAGKISIRGSGALYLQCDTGSDGASVTSASAVPLDANAWHEININRGRTRGTRSIYVAAQSSTATVYLLSEQAPPAVS